MFCVVFEISGKLHLLKTVLAEDATQRNIVEDVVFLLLTISVVNQSARLKKINRANNIVDIHCVVEPGPYWDSSCYEDDDDDASVVTNDHILDTLVQVRKHVMGRDYRALYAVWEVYGDTDDAEVEDKAPPKPKSVKSGADIVSRFKSMMTIV